VSIKSDTDTPRYVIGPPVGGGLYTHFGFRAPFVFGLIVAVLDMGGRLLIIERREALRWGVDPAALPMSSDEQNGIALGPGTDNAIRLHLTRIGSNDTQLHMAATKKIVGHDDGQTQCRKDLEQSTTSSTKMPVSLLSVMAKLARSTRALVAIFVTFVTG
jgi:DHA1 family solute carrier family 18 vesicular amine transporter 1/2